MMSTDNEGLSTDGSEACSEARPSSPLQAKTKESLQFIIFDFRNSSSQPVKGRLIPVNQPQEHDANLESLLEDVLQDRHLSAKVLSVSETEAIFGKTNIHSNTILKYAKVAFIDDKKSHATTHKLIYSERLTKFGTCFADGECLLEDASDLMAFSVLQTSELKVVLEMANAFYRHSNIVAFFMKQKLFQNQSIHSQIKQDISMVHLVLQKPIQIKVINPLQYNHFETLVVECYNTDTYNELKVKIKAQFPDRNFEHSEIRLTKGIEEKDDKESVMTLMKEMNTDNEFNDPGLLRYPSKKFYHQIDTPVLHRASFYFRKVTIKHSAQEMSAFVDFQWSTTQLRDEIAKLTHCYPQSLNLRQVDSDGMERQIPETHLISPYVAENQIIRTGIREKVELMVIVKDLSGMKRFIIYMYDLNSTDDLKLEIATHLNVDSFYIDLFHGKSVLHSSTFKNLGFRRKEEIRVEVERHRIRIRALYVNGNERRKKWLIIDEPEVLTVKELLDFWAVETVCEDSNLRVIYENRCLLESPSLKEAKITHGCTIFICHCPSAFEDKTVPGKIKGIIEAKETGEMCFRHAVTMEGMAFYCNQDFDYEENVSKLRKQRSEERKARKLPMGIRIDSSRISLVNDGVSIKPSPSTPKLFSFPSVQNKKDGDVSPTIHGGEYGMLSPSVKRRIDFNTEEFHQTATCFMTDKKKENDTEEDNLSCRTFPLQKAKKRHTNSTTQQNKRSKFDEDCLPDFQELLRKRGYECKVLQTSATENRLRKMPNKKAHSVCMDFDYSSRRQCMDFDYSSCRNVEGSGKLVKQSKSTTKLYALPGTSGFLRQTSHISHDFISTTAHMYMSSDHESPRLVEIEQPHPIGLDYTDGLSITTKKGIPEKTLHDISKIVTCKWKVLARELGLESPAVNKIDEGSDHDVVEKIYQTLMAWKQKEGTRATLQELAKSFQNLDHNETAERIQDIISDK